MPQANDSKLIPAFAYLRVSGKSQIDGDGFPRQRAAIQAYAKANGVRIVQWFEERGISGTTEWDERPAWVEMIGSLNGVRTIIVERLDRLARDFGVQEFILRDLKKREVVLISTAEPDLGETDPTRVLFRQLVGCIAQYERAMIEAKLRRARAQRRASGVRCEGRKPYGHREGEQAILDRLRKLRSSGLGFDKIAAQMNADGVKPRSGARWHGQSVNKILRRSGLGGS